MSTNPTPTQQETLEFRTDNPFEQMIERALIEAGMAYQTDHDGTNPSHLDFYVPAIDVHIEVKTMHSERVAEQMSRAANVIVAQGRGAIEWLAAIIPKHLTPANPAPAERTRVEGEQLATQIVGTVFDNTAASYETLKQTMVERITDWLAAAPADNDAESLLQHVAYSGVEFDDNRMGYVVVQIDRDVWEQIKKLAPTTTKGDR